jgi:beta-glucosidase-like glycosyl hydrolase
VRITRSALIRFLVCGVLVAATLVGTLRSASIGIAQAAGFPWLQTSRPLEDRVNLLLAQLTQQEKNTLVEWASVPSGDSEAGYIAGIPRLDVPSLRLTDGPAGVRDGQSATAFPVPISTAASFDTDLAGNVGAQMGEETRARGYQVLFGPMVNIERVPLGGRNFETYGEDPYLTGRIADADIAGIQSQRVAAQPKHFVANDEENDRYTASSDVDERSLHEIYLKPFQVATTKGLAWSVMCAVNQVNGKDACEDFPLLYDMLADQWGYDGMVGTDWSALHSTTLGALAGTDQEFSSTYYSQANLTDAENSGLLTTEILDDMVRRVLRLEFRTGQFDGLSRPTVDPAAGAALARTAAAQGTVLLKNDADLLPLSVSGLHSVAVIGPYGNRAYTGGGGSSHVTAYSQYEVSPVDGIKARLGSGTTVSYTAGQNTPPAIPASALSNLQAQFYNNARLSGSVVASRSDSVIDFDWHGGSPASGVNATNWSARWTGTLNVPTTGDYTLGLASDDGSRVYIDGTLVVDAWRTDPGQTQQNVVHLSAGAHALKVLYYQKDAWSKLSLGWWTPDGHDPGIQQATTAAKAADVAIVVVGDTSAEGADRLSLDLPGNQNALVAAVAGANPRTVVVLNTGAPVTMPWLSGVHALVEAWYPGEQDGNALADVLFGAVNPSAKLPVTFPVDASSTPIRSTQQYPGTVDSSGIRHYSYSEKLQVGYRWYDATNTTPLFPFGFGLSYTSFRYANLSISAPDPATGSVTVGFDLTNVGSRPGAEAAQVYLGFPTSAGEPPRQLVGFSRVPLTPGQTRHVTLTVTRDQFAMYDVTRHAQQVLGGTYTVSVGSSSAAAKLTGTVSVPASATAVEATGAIVGIGSKCVDVAGANPADGTRVQIYDCNQTAAQLWHRSADGTLRALGKCLSVAGGDTADGTPIELRTCAAPAPSGSQIWQPQPNRQLRNPNSGRCLDISGGDATNATPLQLATCASTSPGPSQAWNVPRPSGRIRGIGGKCVDVARGSSADGAAIQLHDCNSTGAQDWTLKTDSTIRAFGKCLALTADSTASGTTLELRTCHGVGGSSLEHWRARSDGNLQNLGSGGCIDATDGNTANGTRLQIWACNSNPQQTWSVPSSWSADIGA